MSLSLSLDDLMAYGDWERAYWLDWFEKHGETAFHVDLGPNRDGRFATVADVVRHIFAVEKRYSDRLSGRALTDPASIPTELHAVFEFGRGSRKAMRALLAEFPADRWDVPETHTVATYTLRLTPRKIVVHAVLHELRHWAQIATILRQNGHKIEPRDFLLSPVFGGDPRSAASTR
jgi:uncharacterized damage-inducible protein DinB